MCSDFERELTVCAADPCRLSAMRQDPRGLEANFGKTKRDECGVSVWPTTSSPLMDMAPFSS
ncbi:hypothetical protein P3T76_011193 [Phytophthora citrophthora]|uniref:Uncharacterized protein n=1 Tax=Phytophthora citrophthora TaxID=4793 RepID=A0AAD9LGL5_9STRA|nr:hypothetical protein P3T76_011192 [Phytophthora citrophthora]KAK1934584.1 hypothetical protein P3T76_011193 [Phytophthora citrophthora]